MELSYIKKYKKIYIYGAGKIGKKVYNILSFFNIKVANYVISKYDGTYCVGNEVIEIAQVKSEPEESYFIITTPDIYNDEIIDNLERKGYKNYTVWNSVELNELWRCTDYTFEDRRKKADKCCFVLAGYKDFLWDDVFDRIESYTPKDIDVCIISSGLYNESLSKKAEANNWSYLATKINSVTLVQNVAMALYEDYKWVYKIDEDMFVTENAFDKLMNCYVKTAIESNYNVGIVAPLIPINGYGYKIILNKLDKEDYYSTLFGKIEIGGNPDSEIEKNPNAAVFMWDKTLQLDELNRLFEQEDKYSVCGVRFSIGFILMKHDFWDKMNGFFVSGNPDMGSDEEEVCANCIINSKAIIICENTVVGHFSFGRQTELMKEYYNNHRDWFKIH